MRKGRKRSYSAAILEGKEPRRCIVVDFPSALMTKLSPAEQNLFITFALASNELSALERVVTIAGHQEHEGFIYDSFVNSQYVALIKLFAGKIFETWELIRRRYFGTKLSAKYDRLLSDDASAALKALKKYFGHSKNIVSLLRNEGAFHYSRADVNAAIKSNEHCRMFLSGRAFYNRLYQFADHVMVEHLCDQITEKPADALRIIHEDVAAIGSITELFLMSILDELFLSVTEGDEEKCAIGDFKISLASRKRRQIGIPIFFDVSEYDLAQIELGKRLPRLIKYGRNRIKAKQPTYSSTEHLKDFLNIRRLR